jgi:hypothetical protein
MAEAARARIASRRMRALVGCETSGKVREELRRLGVEAYSNDLLPSDDGSPFHIQGDILELLERDPHWDLFIAHPPCTYLCNSSVWALYGEPGNPSPGVLYGEARVEAMREAASFFRSLLLLPIPKIALENPTMHGDAQAIVGRPPNQSIQPYEFGDDASKQTCLWLKGLRPLRKDPALYVPPRIVKGLPRWSNQTDSGQNKITPSADRWKIRAETYGGIARAMAQQWAGQNEPVDLLDLLEV